MSILKTNSFELELLAGRVRGMLARRRGRQTEPTLTRVDEARDRERQAELERAARRARGGGEHRG